VTWWRRLRDWQTVEVWDRIHQAFLTLSCALICFNHCLVRMGYEKHDSVAFAAAFNVIVMRSMIGISA
jgi:hypothetical protein